MAEPGIHAEWRDALDKFDAGDPMSMLKVALRARAAADDGTYCTCDDPIVAGLALMCERCLLQNRDQERRRVAWIVAAHDYVPRPDSRLPMCERCSQWEDHERHRGVDGIGRCSWGEELLPPDYSGFRP